MEPALGLVSTQIPPPSKDASPIRVTVRFELICVKLTLHGGVPGGGEGTMKFTWYRPAYPGVRPEKIGCNWEQVSSEIGEQPGGRINCFEGGAFGR